MIKVFQNTTSIVFYSLGFAVANQEHDQTISVRLEVARTSETIPPFQNQKIWVFQSDDQYIILISRKHVFHDQYIIWISRKHVFQQISNLRIITQLLMESHNYQ